MSTVIINTPLHVPIKFALSVIDKRFGAWVIDFIVRFLGFWILFSICKNLFLYKSIFDDGYNERLFAISILSLLPCVFYFLLFEIFGSGQSVGKKLLKIRVVSIDGYKPTVTQYIIRWVMRIADVSLVSLLFLGKLGIFTMWWGWGFALLAIFSFFYTVRNKNRQRLGDAAAGTVVINLKPNLKLTDTIFEETYSQYKVTYTNVLKLSDRDITIIKKALTSYELSHNDSSLWLICEKLESILGIQNTTDPYDLLSTIMRDYNHLSTN